MAKKTKADDAQDATKDKKSKGKKSKGKRGSKDEPHTDDGASVANHPRASAQVRAAKGWGGLVCFAAAGGLSLAAGDPTFQALLQALIAGIIGCLLGWACSVMIWRQVLVGAERHP